jgi:hypothetical protein
MYHHGYDFHNCDLPNRPQLRLWSFTEKSLHTPALNYTNIYFTLPFSLTLFFWYLMTTKQLI